MVALDGFMKQYKDEEWFQKYVEGLTKSLDIEQSFLDAKKETNFDIPENYKEIYRDYFAFRKRELQEAYHKVYEEEQEIREKQEQR